MDLNFGFQKVRSDLKTEKVQQVFRDVSDYYDLMNDIMSAGLHRSWKEKMISYVNPLPNDCILDLACGTGDLAIKALSKEPEINIVLCDLNSDMLELSQSRLTNQNHLSASVVQANAENLPYLNDSFDKCMIAFGIRNVTHIDKALKELYRVTRDFGSVYIMEFSLPSEPIPRQLAKQYLDYALPMMGTVVANDAKSYQYLSESIQLFPQPVEFISQLKSSGFRSVTHIPMMFSSVNLFCAHKV
tara:strand:+ start:5588 stop:6319 length:732 start_codon:yes stop_codon:yes gene_type:complete